MLVQFGLASKSFNYDAGHLNELSEGIYLT